MATDRLRRMRGIAGRVTCGSGIGMYVCIVASWHIVGLVLFLLTVVAAVSLMVINARIDHIEYGGDMPWDDDRY